MASDDTARRGSLNDLLCLSLAPLFWSAERVGAVSAWWTHVPFAHWLVHEARPRILVELGTHDGVSYSAFCQAVLLSGLSTRCHAVDTRRGDPQSGEYGEEVYEAFRRVHDDRFAAFSTLLRCTFDEAQGAFADKSIDVLHIEGYHAFDAVTHDFERWLPKLSDQAVVLLHDTNERRDDFGVWRVFEELRERYPAFEFLHGHGLGVLAVGAAAPRAIFDLCALSDPASVASVRDRFTSLGERWRCVTEFQIFERDARRQLEAAAAMATEMNVELDRARARAQAQVEQAHAEAQAQAELVRAEAECASQAIRREADERVAQEAARVEAFKDAVGLAEQRAQIAEAVAEASNHRVAAIEGSTLWRATAPLRRMAGRFPRARREARRALRVAYWTLSLQLPRRLRDRSVQHSRSRALAASPPPWCQGGRIDPFARVSSLSDQEWLSILVRSVEEPVIDGIRMPSFPGEVTQKTVVGSVGAHTLREAFNFFSTVKKYCDRLDCPLDGQTRLLDFGCGWGRILRFFLKDCSPSHLWGIDVDPGLVTVCRDAMPFSNFTACDPLPPTAFADQSFDVITAYSVFSHLAEHASLAWVKEFARVLKPGGIMVVTTEPREFIELCRSLRGREHEFAWYRALAESFVDTDAAYRAYDAGQYLYAPTGGGPNRPADFYGEALIPETYVRARWTPFLRFVDFVSDPSQLPQALVVMQKG